MARPNEPRGGQLRVALDTTYAGVNPTGVGLYSRRLAAGLRADAAELGIDLSCFGPACSQDISRSRFAGLFQEWPTYTHGVLPARLLASHPQIVHSTSHIGPLWSPGRLIVTVHDLIFMRYPHDYQAGWLLLTRLLLPLVLLRSTAIIADSRATKEDIRQFFGVRDGKIVVIYPGVDVPAQPTMGVADAASAVAGGHPFILCPGPWVRRKNIEVVMQAFALLAPRVPDIHLVVTGDRPPGMSGPRASDLLAHVPAPYHDRVHLTGYVTSDMRNALFAQAALLCYPSKYEGFGLPPLEAMSVGVPVIVASTPACVEVTGTAALVVDADDPSGWASAIESVLSGPALARNLRAKGLARSATFTWSRCVRRTAQLYHRAHGA